MCEIPKGVFEDAIGALFDGGVHDYGEYPEREFLSFQLEDCEDLTYAQLEALSALLGTDEINFTDGYWSDGCPTCAWWIRPRVQVSGVVFPPRRCV